MALSPDFINTIYAAFNARDIDGALAPMSDNVSWPKASEGGRVVGKAAIAEYWKRQWSEFDPKVEPVSVSKEGTDKLRVRVHQVVKDLHGALLSASEVWHVYTVNADGLIERMDVEDGRVEADVPSAAFAKHRNASS